MTETLTALSPEPTADGTAVRFRVHAHHRHHQAVLAVNPSDGAGLGVARYIRHEHDRDSAEVAVTVVDEWRGTGLGTQLLIRLAVRARDQGIRRLTIRRPDGNATSYEIELP